MKIKLHKGQYDIATDPHRFKVVCCGRRWGKSVLSRMMVLKWALANEGLYWIVSPTYVMGKDIHWLQGFKREIGGAKFVTKWNDADLSITLNNGSMIQLRSAENPDRLRGVKLRGLIVDEIAQLRNWDWIWSEALRPTLTDFEAPAIFISTPKGFNHFYKLFNTKSEQYKSWHFTSYDNPYIPKGEVDQAKKELTEDTFHQEYMADFRKYTGLIYKDFSRETHVVESFDIPNEWSKFRAIDFGSTNPTACLWIAVDGDENTFIYNEHYETGKTIDYHAGIINSKTGSTHIRSTYGDPSGTQWISEFAQRGIYITPAIHETGQSSEGWVRFGIDKVAQKLKCVPGHTVSFPRTGSVASRPNPQLFIFNNCQNTIREFETYRWQERKETQAQDLNTPEQPEKANDHCMDALRYFAVSYKSVSKTDKQFYGDDYQYLNKPEEAKVWRIGK